MAEAVNTRVKLTIDGRPVEVPRGTLLIEAARQLGIEIPFFCYHQKLKSDGNCRMCLVAVEKMPKLQVSCSLPAADGMVVQTATPQVADARKTVLDFILANHPLDCPICDEGGRCPLQDYSHKYTAAGGFDEEKRRYEKEYFSPLIEKEMNRCIQCMRCVRYCDEVIDAQALAPFNRGFETEIGHYADKQLDCEFCGGCIQICPVGALLNRQSFFEYRPWMLTKTETTCSHCADGCGMRLEARQSTREIIEVTSFWGNETKTVWGQGRNEGDLCAKGYFGADYVNSPERLTRPLVRRDGALVEAQGTHRWLTSYEEIAAAEALLVIGSDITQTNPITALKVKAAAKRGAQLIVATPLRPRVSTRSNIVNRATLHLAHRPGAERAVAIGLVKAALQSGAIAPEIAQSAGVTALAGPLAALTPEQIEAASGVPYAQLTAAAAILCRVRTAVILFGEDVIRAADGYDTVRVLADLALVSGKLTADGSGLAPLLRENNELGALEMGVDPDRVPGGLRDSAADRDRVARAWNEPLPGEPGLTLLEMLRGARVGRVKAFYLLGENPIDSLPASAGADEALGAAEFVVYQGLFLTATARTAHVVLPAASWAEQNGTFTNHEGRVLPVRKAIEPLHGTRPDWEILSQIALYLGCAFEYQDGAEITHEIARLWPEWRARPARRTEAAGAYAATGVATRLERYRTDPAPAPGMVLAVGPVLFHSGQQSLRSNGLLKVHDGAVLYLGPEDAARVGVADGERVQIQNGLGSVTVPVKIDAKYPPGMVFFPVHFNDPPVKQLLPLIETLAGHVPVFRSAGVELAAVPVSEVTAP